MSRKAVVPSHLRAVVREDVVTGMTPQTNALWPSYVTDQDLEPIYDVPAETLLVQQQSSQDVLQTGQAIEPTTHRQNTRLHRSVLNGDGTLSGEGQLQTAGRV